MYSTRPASGRAASFFRVSISRRASAVSKWSSPCTRVRSSRISRTGPCASSYFPARPNARAFAYSSLARWASALESSRRGAAGFSAPRAARVSAEAASANQRVRSLIVCSRTPPPAPSPARRGGASPAFSLLLPLPEAERGRGGGVVEQALIGNSPAARSLLAVGHGEGDDLNRLELGAALEELTQLPQRLRHVFPRLDPSPLQGEPDELAPVEVPAPGPALLDPLPGGRAGLGAPVLVRREGLRGGGQHEHLKSDGVGDEIVGVADLRAPL